MSQSINLDGRFTLDEDKAREWLAGLVAAWENGDDNWPEDEAPGFGNSWEPRQVDEESNVWRLVRYAADNGIIGRPDGMDVDFEYVADSDGGMYHYTVEIGHEAWKAVYLATYSYEVRKLGAADTAGIDAAMAILDEAVRMSNQALDNLSALVRTS